MATEAARIVINIDTNARQADSAMRGLNQSTKQAGQSAGGTTKAFQALKSIGIAALAAAAARAIGRVAGQLVTAASNAEETANKFNVTFRGIEADAQAAAQSLATNFGLAQDQAQGLLADTGDLLTGFGFTRESALDLSTQVNELAVDLASFTNFSGGAEGASQALTKALLGERESLKSLGIAITEADIERLAEEKGIVGELTRQQKAALTLELAIQQSGNAIGDFERSQASFANQTRIAEANIRDQSVAIGSALLPLANIAVTTFNRFAGQITATANRIRDFVTSAQGATRIGEIFGFIGGVFRTVFDIGRELFEIGFGIWRNVIDTVVETFNDLIGESQNTGIGLEILGGVVQGVVLGFKVFAGTVSLSIELLGDIIRIARESAQALGAIGQVVRGEISFAELKEEFADVGEGFQNLGRNVADNFNAIVATAQEGIRNFGSDAAQRAASIREAFNETSDSVSENVTTALRNAAVQSNDVALSAEATRDALQDAAPEITTVADESETAADELERYAQAAEKAFEALGSINTGFSGEPLLLADDESSAAAEEASERLLRTLALRRASIENFEERQRQLVRERNAREMGAVMVAEEAARRRAEADEEAAERSVAAWERRNQVIDAAQGVVTSFTNFYTALIDRQIAALEASGASEEEVERRRRQLLRERAIAEKATSLFTAVVDGAQAIVKAFSIDPTGILAAFVGAATALQIGAIAAQPLPQAQFGGSFVVPPGNPQDSGLLRVNQGERVDVSPARGGDRQPMVVKLQLGTREFVQVVEDVFNSQGGQIRNPRAVRAAT